MTPAPITLAVEGSSDEAIARKLLATCGFSVENAYVQGGKSRLDQKLSAFNAAAEYSFWFVLRDLDQDADCAPHLLRDLLPTAAPKMCFRIAIHAADAWLMADQKNLGQFLGVPMNKVPRTPDSLIAPKTELVNLARKSKKKQIREDMVPREKATTTVGPAYVSRVIEFADAYWDPQAGAQSSESLASCIAALEKLRRMVS